MAVTEKTKIGVIDLTPTWEEVLPTLLTVYADAGPEGRNKAREELERMAKLADMYGRSMKRLRRTKESFDPRYLGTSGDMASMLMKLNSILADKSPDAEG